ncbi:Uncharacterised protein at_DN2157, partial [Pycnogonum litorale]
VEQRLKKKCIQRFNKLLSIFDMNGNRVINIQTELMVPLLHYDLEAFKKIKTFDVRNGKIVNNFSYHTLWKSYKRHTMNLTENEGLSKMKIYRNMKKILRRSLKWLRKIENVKTYMRAKIMSVDENNDRQVSKNETRNEDRDVSKVRLEDIFSIGKLNFEQTWYKFFVALKMRHRNVNENLTCGKLSARVKEMFFQSYCETDNVVISVDKVEKFVHTTKPKRFNIAVLARKSLR